MSTSTIAFIGGGNMATSLIGGLRRGGWPAEHIRVAEPDPAKREHLASQLHVETATDNTVVARDAQIVLLAVKPQVVRSVAAQLGPALAEASPLVISIAAGVREPDIRRWLGFDAAVVRAMPNTPALVSGGATGLYANERVSNQQRDLAETVLRSVGMTIWVDEESELDAVTALSGSGPAYFFLVMEAMERAGVALGLPRETARLLTLETAFGAAKMALESTEGPEELRARVTSPGGTTERAIAVLQGSGLTDLFSEAIGAARDRAVEIGRALGEN